MKAMNLLLQLPVLSSLLYVIVLCSSDKISICKIFDGNMSELGKVEEECRGQTVFIQEPGRVGPKGEPGKDLSNEIATIQTKLRRLQEDIHNTTTKKVIDGQQILQQLQHQILNLTDAINATVSLLKKSATTSHDSFFCGVGIKDGRIPNSAMTASSHYGAGNEAYYARLDKIGYYRSFWHAAYGHYPGSWVQVDLGKPTRVVGVVTQGRPNKVGWITKYKILYGNTTANLTSTRVAGKDYIYNGNSDRNSKVTNFFYHPITARYFRLVAVQYEAAPALRLEYLEC